MTSQPGKQRIAMYILTNISRMEFNIKNFFFLKNHTQNVMEKLFSYPLLKNQN